MRSGHTRLPTDAEPAPSGADDARAIARYLYLLRTAPPEAIEQVHAEAFRALDEPQRRELLARIGAELPPYERALATPVNGTPVGLARLITRAEMRRPGTVARLFGAGAGVAGVLGASLLGGIAGAVAGSALAAPFLAGAPAAGATHASSPTVGEPDAPGSDDVREGWAGDLVADAGSGDEGGIDFGLDGLFDV